MAESLAKQLAGVKLKPSKDKTKDFSDPKLAGLIDEGMEHFDLLFSRLSQRLGDQFVSEKCSRSEYRRMANLSGRRYDDDVHLPRHPSFRLETFGTVYFPLSSSDAEHFIRIFQRHFQSLHDRQEFQEISERMSSWSNDDPEEKQWFDQLNERLQKTIDVHFSKTEGFFAKTSSRSAKDASLFRKDFLTIYREQLSNSSSPHEENSRLIALLTAAFLCLRVRCAEDVLSMFIISERIYQDMLLALEVSRQSSIPFVEHLVLRPFVPIDVDMEFRGFVFQEELTCLSQYNYLIYSARLIDQRETILAKILRFFNETVKKKLRAYSAKSYVIDFALTQGGETRNRKKAFLLLSVV